jgi:hypothetical protein
MKQTILCIFKKTFSLSIAVFICNYSYTQIINENFEEDVWTNITGTTASGSIIITSSSANNTVTYFTAYGTFSTSTGSYVTGTSTKTTSSYIPTATSTNTSPNSGTWYYSRASAGLSTPYNTKFSRMYSYYNWMGLSSGGYIVTPVIQSGVATVTFWVSVGSDFAVGIYTNTNAVVNPTHKSIDPSGGTSTNTISTIPSAYTYASQIFQSTILQANTVNSNSSGTATVGVGAQKVSFSGSFSGACRIGIFNLGSSGVGIDDIVITTTSPLPVNFGGVTATKTNAGVNIKWNILSEINTEKYEVERSNDGSNFNSISTITATNASLYNYTDVSAITNTIFYRIKAIDKNGSYQYSNIIKLNSSNSQQEFIVAPNPVTNHQFTIQLNNFSQGVYVLNLIGVNGQQVYTQTINHAGGSLSQSVQIPPFIKEGIYQVQILNKEMKLTQTIIVQ